MIELYADGDITKEQFKSKKVDIQNLDFKKMFNADSKQEANKILKQIIKKIEVNDEKEVFIHLNF